MMARSPSSSRRVGAVSFGPCLCGRMAGRTRSPIRSSPRRDRAGARIRSPPAGRASGARGGGSAGRLCRRAPGARRWRSDLGPAAGRYSEGAAFALVYLHRHVDSQDVRRYTGQESWAGMSRGGPPPNTPRLRSRPEPRADSLHVAGEGGEVGVEAGLEGPLRGLAPGPPLPRERLVRLLRARAHGASALRAIVKSRRELSMRVLADGAGVRHASRRRHLKGQAVRKAPRDDDAPQRVREHDDGLVVDHAYQEVLDHGDGLAHFVGFLDIAVEVSPNQAGRDVGHLIPAEPIGIRFCSAAKILKGKNLIGAAFDLSINSFNVVNNLFSPITMICSTPAGAVLS